MKQPIRHLLRILLRLLILWAIDAVAMLITIALLPGVTITGAAPGAIAAAAALLLAVINLFLRPIILLLALPLGFFVTFGVGFLVNAIALLIVARVLPRLSRQRAAVGLRRRVGVLVDQHHHHRHHLGGR